MARKPYYMVLRRDDHPSGAYVFATSRKFYRYSEAELYTQSIAITREPIILIVD